MPFVSVLVPVYNDLDGLRLCLEALSNQTYPKSHYEVIAIDNASDNSAEIKHLVEAYRAIYTYQIVPGSYAARNQGISLAKGEIIAFTDADCIPALNWVETGVARLLQVPNCGLVAGKIELFFRNPDKPTPVEVFESMTAFPQARLLEAEKGGATANIFTFKEVFERVGLFNSHLKSNGDLEWGRRVFASGYVQVYADEVCIAHPARYSWQQLYQRVVRLAGGIYDRHNDEKLSLKERYIFFIKDICFHLMPPINFIWNVFINPEIKGIKQKIEVSLVMILFRYTGLIELWRLKLGGISAR